MLQHRQAPRRISRRQPPVEVARELVELLLAEELLPLGREHKAGRMETAPEDDAIHVGVASTAAWIARASAYFGSGNPASLPAIFKTPWLTANHGTETIDIPLDAPFGNAAKNLLPAIDAAGRLDLYVCR